MSSTAGPSPKLSQESVTGPFLAMGMARILLVHCGTTPRRGFRVSLEVNDEEDWRPVAPRTVRPVASGRSRGALGFVACSLKNVLFNRQNSSMSLIVTGAAGHLGRLVAEQLLERVAPEHLVLVTRTPEALREFRARGVEVRYGDF